VCGSPVRDHRNVDVVDGAAAGQHGVELLSGLLTGHDAMHPVGSHALCGMHSRGVPQLGSRVDIAGGECHGAAVPYVPHPHTTITGQFEDGPTVTVLHPVGCGEAKSAVVGPGDDQITKAGPVAVG
jgi:hypothetical protein